MKSIIVLVVFSIVGISLFYFSNSKKSQERELPVYNPIDLDPEVVDPELLRVGRGHRIGEFSFTNQLGKTITNKDVEGSVFVAEYFFTTCQTICPLMNKQMQHVHDAFKDEKKFKILSFTVDPANDDVEQLNMYASAHKADSKNWWFLTGEKADLYNVARKSFFVLKPAEALNLGDAGSDFIHTNNFVLVDKKMRIRGYYDGTNHEEVDQLILDIDLLLKEN